jgi:EAL domain-containing protein (putative c-di-GMP-specific phosphodiesterase class I)
LTLELTEGAMLDQPAQARDMLEQLKSLFHF